MALYTLPDEPRPGVLRRLAVEPIWPLLAVMVVGPWLSWPWFIVNGHAVGSPTRWRETLVALLGFVGTAMIFFAAVLVVMRFKLGSDAALVQLAILPIVLWKLGVTYWLMSVQAPAVELFQYYRGETQSRAVLILIPAYFIDTRVMKALPTFLELVLR